MSSLWTPEGEHRVEREQSAPPPAPATEAASAADDEEVAAPDPELLAELAALERQLLAVPAADVVANHCYGLFQLAALHLAQRPPHLDEARIAIDALAAIVEGLGTRLGDAEPTLRDSLAQIRLAFVQIAGTPAAPETVEQNGEAAAP